MIKRILPLLAIAALAWPAAAQQSGRPPAQGEGGEFMFVQTASSGTLVPKGGKAGSYTLTLNDVAPQTVYFSDRPLRIAGQVPNETFLRGLGFEDGNPPNAAIELSYGTSEGDVVVVELRNPVYHPREARLQYDVTILPDAKEGLAFYSKRRDERLPESFAAVSLFIDSCSDTAVACASSPFQASDVKGFVNAGRCWDGWSLSCNVCSWSRAGAACIDKYGSGVHPCTYTGATVNGGTYSFTYFRCY